mgnify:CR=1 FL=1
MDLVVLGDVDTAGLERAHVCGHSMGGMIALALARAHPERVDRLVLEATARPSLRQLLASWEPLDLSWPDIADPPAEPVDLTET